MAITSNGWEPFWEDLTNTVKGVFANNETDILDNAEENPFDVLPVSDEDKIIIQTAYDEAVDDTIDKTVEDINDDLGGNTNDVPEDQTTFAKLIGGFFILNAVSRAYERLHGAKVARQTQDNERNPDNQEESIEAAINTGNNQIDVVTRNEIGQTYSDAAKSQFEARGEDSFTWIHSGSDHPREDHLDADGNIYPIEEGAPVEGTWPGVAFNCACYMTSVKDTQNRSRSKIMNKKIFNLSVADGVADIYMTGIIGYYDIWNDEGVVFNEFKREMNIAVSSDKVRIFINSPGGYVYDGIAMRELISRMSKTNDIEIHVAGLAASMASLIMLSVPVEKRFIAQGSMVMIHDPSVCACGGRKEFESAIAEFDSVLDSIARIYADETNLSKEKALELMSAETYFNADEAVSNGFANLSQDEPVKSNIEDIKSFMNNVKKTCSIDSVEQKGELQNYVNYDGAKSKDKPVNKGTEMNPEEIKALQDKIAALESSIIEKDAKVQVLENRVTEVEGERDSITTQRDEAIGNIDKATQDALENVKADMAQANEARLAAEKVGFENVDGDTLTQVQQNVLTAAKVSDPEKFEGEQLASMFAFVLESNKGSTTDSSEHDDGFQKNPSGSKSKNEKFVRPTPNNDK